MNQATELLREAVRRLRQLDAEAEQLALLEQWAGVALAGPTAQRTEELPAGGGAAG